MDQKQKLIELILSAPKIDFPIGGRMQGKTYQTASNLAEHLLANGVIAVDIGVVSATNRPLISQCFGHPLDEIIDLIRAKEEGRIIVHPFKIGQRVYSLVESIHRIFIGEIYEVYIGSYGMVFRFTRNGYFTGCFNTDDVGRTIFFDLDEANRALAEREANEM